MSQALQTVNLSAEAVELIKAGNPKPRTEQSFLAAPEPPEVEEKKPALVVAQADTAVSDSDEPEAIFTEAPKSVKRSSAKEKESELPSQGGTVSASFRLPLEIPNALVRASADRKVKRQKPYTQQEIVTEALAQWLKKNGYLS